MNLEMQVSKTQAGLYTVAYGRKEAPLDVQEAAFAANGLGMISPAQKGFLQANESQGIFEPYSRTNAYAFYGHKNERVVIIPNGTMDKFVNLIELVDAHRQGKEYVIPKNQRKRVYELIDAMLINGTAFVAEHGQTSVETSRFGEDDLASRLFSDERLGIQAQNYGDFLKSRRRTNQNFFFDDKNYTVSQKGSYMNRLRVYGPDVGFDVSGSRFLDGNLGAFGVRFEQAAEGGSKVKK